MKRIMVQVGEGANYYIRLALANALQVAGHQVYYWDKAGKSAHDAFVEFTPDIFFGSTWQLDRPLVKNLVSRPDLKVVLYCSHYGSADKDIDQSKYPILFANDEEKRLTEQVSKANNNPIYVITQYNNNRIGQTHDLWKNLGVHPYGLMLCLDATQYALSELDEGYRSDVVFAGGYWPYKSYWLDKCILPLTYPSTIWKVRIFGSNWNIVNSLGQISSAELSKFYRNAGVSPNVFEPHSVDFLPDINQRTYEVSGCGGFQLCQKVVGLEDVFTQDEVVTFDGEADFKDKVLHYLNYPEETIPYRVAGLKAVYGSHTGFHRAAELLWLLDENYESLVTIANNVCDQVCQYVEQV